uniref:hypothetical protein n=1 Tax=Parabacteroides distasonis TaxID=823 RepID=UPI003FEE6020
MASLWLSTGYVAIDKYSVTNALSAYSLRFSLIYFLVICLFYVQGNQERKAELYDLIFDPDDAVSYQALWVCSHFSTKENEWLYDKQDELINEVLSCEHSGKRRILLNLLVRQPQTNPPRVDFLNFCLDRMLSAKELPGVQTLCMKLGYELCRPIPELLQEYKTLLDLAEPDLLQISLRTVRKNILKKIR